MQRQRPRSPSPGAVRIFRPRPMSKPTWNQPVAPGALAKKEPGVLGMELAIVAVLIVVNGLLAMSELAIVSSRPARLQGLADKGVGGSRRALALASNPGKFLSTVQIG